MRIGPYIHACIIRHGDAAGNKNREAVDRWDYMSGTTCQHCGEPPVTTEQLLAHIYAELTEA